ncbi:unnamed protein product [Ostreobium quekettii]|uniref:Mur ligase central domain-containing protein n=1 Tax=Ostreobium quekettii TaxID=121088 RepID=A0A8S1J4B9_9CHLO|nr:unnamed protein product [Ostreobium quekettii]
MASFGSRSFSALWASMPPGPHLLWLQRSLWSTTAAVCTSQPCGVVVMQRAATMGPSKQPNAAARSGLQDQLSAYRQNLCKSRSCGSLDVMQSRFDPFTNRAGSSFHSSGCRGITNAVEFLDSLTNYEHTGVPADAGTGGSDGFPLDRVRALLSRMGDPHLKLKFVHITGSKGKGTVAHFIASVLKESGLAVGLYTSPHVVSVEERICMDGEAIKANELNDLVAQNRSAIEACQASEKGRLTYFEVLTALAFKHFVDRQADIVVTEVGLGGTTDATNVIEANGLVAAVLTPIDSEHLQALGGTIESVAGAKAGIMKAGRPAVLAEQPNPDVLRVLEARAAELGCKITHAKRDVAVRRTPPSSSHSTSPSIDVDFNGVKVANVALRMKGAHQDSNVATALCAVDEVWQFLQGGGSVSLDDHVLKDATRKGLEAVQLPGRFQVVQDHQDLEAPWVVLDGAHTAASAAALVHTLRSEFPSQPLGLIVAMAAEKDHVGVIRHLVQLQPDIVVFTAAPIGGSYERSAPPGTLAGTWDIAEGGVSGRRKRKRKMVQNSVGSALAKARHELWVRNAVICVTGSFYAVSEAIKVLETLPG